jgi:DNA polymerase I
VLVVSHGDIVALLFERADQLGVDFRLGRLPGYDRLAGENTFHSYGRVGHSPARYDVPGRAIIDAGHSFFWNQTSLEGIVDLVDFSHKPLQEVGWASIGNVLTAIEIREARERDVLAPWNKWEPESFKTVETLHEADRGGFIFDPDVGVHEGVREVDFSSLYPNVIRHMNVSPETVDCACCDGADVPGLDYSICEERGFLPDVLAPLLDHRASLKKTTREAEAADDEVAGDDEAEVGGDDAGNGETAREARSRVNALKWILVACFGYQGYRNSKFGRIECHETINAYARDVLLTAKERFEAAGWHVVHGIVDSLWLTPARDDPDPIEAICDDLHEAFDVPLEFENRYDWLALVPKRDSESGALTKYFGKVADAEEYKVRGIECRQRSTPPFVADVQRDLLETLDARRDLGAVCDVLERRVGDLRANAVDPGDLAITTRVSKRLAEYAHETRTVAALRRARDLDVEYLPGETVRYVVVDDDASAANRVRLAFEEPTRYDADFYADQLARATESVVSPLGWRRSDIDAYLNRGEDVGLGAFVSE